MPNIKIQDRQQTIGVVPAARMQEDNVSPKVADLSAPWGALAKVGEGVQDIGVTMIKADQAMKTTAAKLKFDSDMDKLLTGFLQRSDRDKFDDDFTAQTDALRQKYSEEYGSVWGRVEPYAEHKIANTQIHVNNHGRKLWLGEMEGLGMDSIDRLQKEMSFYAPGSPERELTRQKITDVVNDMTTNLIIDKAKGSEMLRAVDNNADLYAVEAIRIKSPELAQQMLMERDANGRSIHFPNLTPQQYGQELRRVDDEIRSKQRQFYEEQNRYQDEVRYKVYDMMDRNVPFSDLLKFIDTQTTPDAKTGFRGLDAREAFALKEKIRNEGSEGGKTSFVVWQNLYKKGLDGTLTHDDILRSWGSGLSTGDAKGLSTMLTKGEQKEVRAIDHLVKESMTNFAQYAKATIGESKNETSKDLAAAVIYDVQKVSKFVTDKSDMKWFEEYQMKSVEQAVANNDEKYLAKYLQRLNVSSSYEKMFEGTAPGSRMNAPASSGSKSTGVTPAQVSEYKAKISAVFGDDAERAIKVAQAESGINPVAHNSGGGGTGAFGLFQIRGKLHRKTLVDAGIIKTDSDLFDPDTNIKAAKFLYDKYGWEPWKESKGMWDKGSNDQWTTLPNGKKIRRVG
jgi:hypothetical protein